MVDSGELATLLRDTPGKIVAWRAQAAQLGTLVEAARITREVSDSLLLSVEQTAESIYAEIASYSAIVRDVAETSPAAAAELSVASDALHLVLMEITELGTAMYAVRSQLGHAEEALLPPPASVSP